MKAHDLFGLLIRTTGLAGLVLGWYLGAGVFYNFDGDTVTAYALASLPTVAAGLILIFGADPIVWLSYREVRRNSAKPPAPERSDV